MPSTNSFRDLDVWQEAMTLVEEIYHSVPSNIGEGARRKRRKAYLHHLDIALGSQGEVDVQLEIAKRLAYCSVADHRRVVARVDRVGRMLNGLIASLQPVEEDWRD